jgi:hypothetical protein
MPEHIHLLTDEPDRYPHFLPSNLQAANLP